MAIYTLHCSNNSSLSGDICVFQQNPDSSNPDILPLVWTGWYAYPGGSIFLNWDTEYSFALSRRVPMICGSIFEPTVGVLADLTTNNTVTVTKKGDSYEFINLTTGPQQGTLTINCDNTIAMYEACVGITMSGGGTFAAPAKPDMTFIFTSQPEFWVAFGNFQLGEALDVRNISVKAQLVFPDGIYSMSVSFNEDHTWTITQGVD